MMLITKEEFLTCIEGFGITNCAVRDRNIYYFSAYDLNSEADPVIEQTEIKKRVFAFFLDEEKGDRLDYLELIGMERLFAGVSILPKSQFVGVHARGGVYVFGQGDDDFEDKIPVSPEGPRRGGVQKLKTIGEHLYVASGRRGLCRRMGPNNWESLCPTIDNPPKNSKEDRIFSRDSGFNDIDGFSENDIYACGGYGDLWRYHDGNWRQIDFPSNMILESICCADDGKVYIGAQSGTLIVGRENEWKLLWRGDLSLPFVDLVSHAGRLWGTNSYGLWVLEGDEMVRADLPEEIKVCAGSLSVADGVMLMAGEYGAALMINNEWQLIFNVFQEELK